MGGNAELGIRNDLNIVCAWQEAKSEVAEKKKKDKVSQADMPNQAGQLSQPCCTIFFKAHHMVEGGGGRNRGMEH